MTNEIVIQDDGEVSVYIKGDCIDDSSIVQLSVRRHDGTLVGVFRDEPAGEWKVLDERAAR